MTRQCGVSLLRVLHCVSYVLLTTEYSYMLGTYHLRNKTCFPCLHSLSGENQGEHLGELESRTVKTRDAVEVFTCSRILTNFAEVFQQAMEAWTTYFVSCIKLLFSLLTKRKTIYKVHTVNSFNSETVKPHCSHHFRAS